MYRKLSLGEKSQAAETDKEVKNKWNYNWLEEKVKVVIKFNRGTEKTEKEVELVVKDSISKIDRPGEAHCSLCCDTLKYGSKGKSALLNHLRSEKHLRIVQTKMTTQSLCSFGKSTQSGEHAIFTDTPPTSTTHCMISGSEPPRTIVPMKDRVSNQEAAVLAVVAEQSWSFSAASVVIGLAKSLAADPEALNQLSLDRTTAAYKMKYGLGASFTERTANILKKTKFSLNIDEATNIGTDRVLTVLVNYVDPLSKRLTLEHLGSLKLVRVDAASVFSALDNLLKEKEIPWRNCMSLLMDSCAVMRGAKQGLEERVRKQRAPHLLDIDGDVCHHVHNATKAFCAPFCYWAEGLFGDIFNEFHWSSTNQDALQELSFLLGVKFFKPQHFVSHRWLSCFDVAQSTLIQFNALTVYCFSFLSPEDRTVYKAICDSVCKDISCAGHRRISEIQNNLKKKARTEEGQKRKHSLISKLFVNRKYTQMVLGIYTAVLPCLKEYVCLFQSSGCLVHKLQDEQLKLLKAFLAMFMKPQAFCKLSPNQLKKTLSIECEEDLLPVDKMFVGAAAGKELSGWKKGEKIKVKFHETVRSAYIACGKVLQSKLPINNKLLRALSVLDPDCDHNHSLAQDAFLQLPELVINVLPLPDSDDDATMSPLDRYHTEVRAFCTRAEFPPSENNGVAVPVDEWWAIIGQKGQYPLLYSMVTALLTCFHGPAVESSFNILGDVMDSKSSRMAVSTYSAIQTVKYAVRSKKKSATELFKRKHKLYTPVNQQMCRKMRGAAAQQKQEQARQRQAIEDRRQQLSLKAQQELSKQKLKALNAEAEKRARIAHRRLMRSKLEKLSKKRRKETFTEEPASKKSKDH